MANRIQHRRDTAANWTSINPVLAAGEIGMETDTGNTKLGDGVTAWASLGYQAPNAATLSATYVPKPAGIADGQVPVWQASSSTWIAGAGGGGIPTNLDGGNASSVYTGTFNFDGGSAT